MASRVGWRAAVASCATVVSVAVAAGAQAPARAEEATAVVFARHGDSTRMGLAVLVRGPLLVAMPLDLVLGASAIRLRFGDGEVVDVTGLVDLDDRRNVALMRARVVDRTPLSPAAAMPAVQARVVAIAARDSTLVATDATIGALAVSDGVRSAPLGAALPPLWLGAPVVDAAGELVGVLVRAADGAARVLPVSALVALDATRAPTPMATVAQLRRPSTPARDSAATAPPDSLVQRRIVEALRALSEFEVAHNLMVTLAQGYGFRNGPPRIAYELQPELATAKANLAAVADRAGATLALSRTTLRMIDALAASSADYMQAVTAARATGTWGPQAEALGQRSAAAAGTYGDLLPIFRDQLRAAIAADTTFRRALGDELLQRWDAIPTQSEYRLGLYSLVRNPFRIIYQPEGTFGFDLGFRTLDVIVATGDQRWGPGRSVDEFKLYLAERLGQTVVVTIERNGQPMELRVAMPRRIPDKYQYRR